MSDPAERPEEPAILPEPPEEPAILPEPPEEPAILPQPPEEPAVAPEPEPVPEPSRVPGSLAETAAEIRELDADAPRVAIVASEREDLSTLEHAEAELRRRSITSETRVMSADEEPHAVADYTENARARGIRVIIAGAGPHARLPAAITVHTRLPVIGVPLSSRHARAEELGGLLAGRAEDVHEPVAWVGLDDAVGAAVLAARILGD